ncbi:helix-turn-helix domain-containing protein [Streptomyces javensis]|uniref:Helix-turn-helix domain-containing protein n=1 Tax=Streptomyces javensis TaxID=114698 RepID=A0ABS0R572_9ACTN|nr:helix-turn-helix transcriptional regulator [Streptomyces javensis]MBI0312016.1 helix-turn-helix domain-containing protein [Streptomyces javensis]
MGRREKPVTTSRRALRELAEWLREQRERVGLSYRELAVRAAVCHATTLQRAASGDYVPPLPTVLAYARACDASPKEARRLWAAARCEEKRAERGGRSLPAPRPQYIRDLVELSAALVDLYEKAGSPPLRTMEHRAGEYGLLPHSTAGRIVHKQTVPKTLRQFDAYLRACEVPENEWPAWQAAWNRAWRQEKQDDFLSASLSLVSREAAEMEGWRVERHRIDDPELIGELRKLHARVQARSSRKARARPRGRAQHRVERAMPGQQLALPVGETPTEVSTLW